jgi:protein arginine kinase activator
MLCDDCRERAAEVHLTAIEKEEVRTLHLCTACAGERGLTAPDSPGEGPEKAPLVDFLAQLGTAGAPAPVAAQGEPCPFCGTAVSDFRETGRVGCAQCYVHFERQLRGLLRRIHGSAQHAGKLYISDPSDLSDRQGRISSMRRQLQRAVETEDFETAAELRDRIHELEAEA